jgi:hypothetical protein
MVFQDVNLRHRVNLPIVVSLVLGTLVIFLCLGNRFDHHYDEFGYMYAAANYTPSEIAAGHFEASNIDGYFDAKIGHIFFLRFLIGLFGQGITAIKAIQAVYTALIIGAGAMMVWMIGLLWGNWLRALVVGLLFLLTPVSVYVGPKLLAETPGFFSGVASLLLLVLCLRTPKRGLQVLYSLASAILLTASLLSRGNMLLMVAGGWFALWVVCPPGMRRGSILINSAIVGALAVVFLFFSQELFGLDLLGAIHSVGAVTNLKYPWRKKVWQILYTFGPFLAVLPFAVASEARQEFRFYGIWLACSILPLVVGLRYMEVRFLMGGAPAMAGMAMLGGEVLWGWLRTLRLPAMRIAGIGLVALIMAGSNHYIQPKTTYELDTNAYENVMGWIRNAAPHQPILVPWGWSDYHFLRMAYPEEPVYLANTTTFFAPTNYVREVSKWGDTLERWYGDRYVGNLATLKRLERPWLFLSWETSGYNTHHWSWIWDDPNLRRTLVYKHKKYRVYQLDENE